MDFLENCITDKIKRNVDNLFIIEEIYPNKLKEKIMKLVNNLYIL